MKNVLRLSITVKKLSFCSGIMSMLLLASCLQLPGGAPSAQQKQVVWSFSSLESIGGSEPTIIGEPKIIADEKGGKAVAFDGKGDGLLLPVNPVAGAEEFTIAVEFKPYAGYPDNTEQRFLHIQDPENEARRILIELRLNAQNQWFADFYMRTEKESLVLIDSTKTHPVNEWAVISLIYKDGIMRGYVNGTEEQAGAIEYLPLAASAKTSLGTRMDRRSWFKGAIRSVQFSHEAKTP